MDNITTQKKGKGRIPVRLFPFTFFLLIVLLIVYYLLSFSSSALVVRDTASNRLLWEKPVSTESAFSIRWTHSIHRTPVEEFFHVEGTQLVLYRMSFKEYGIGMESQLAPGEHLVFGNDTFFIEGMNRLFPSIHLYIGQIRANHTLVYEGKEIPFSTLDKPGASVTIQVEQRSMIDKIGG